MKLCSGGTARDGVDWSRVVWRHAMRYGVPLMVRACTTKSYGDQVPVPRAAALSASGTERERTATPTTAFSNHALRVQLDLHIAVAGTTTIADLLQKQERFPAPNDLPYLQNMLVRAPTGKQKKIDLLNSPAQSCHVRVSPRRHYIWRADFP